MDKERSLFSNFIFSLSSQKDELTEFISKESISRVKFYQRNFYALILEKLKKDYPACKLYLGENNFAFLVSKYIRENRADSPDLSLFCQNFCDFIVDIHDFHLDDILFDLVKIDNLWTYGLQKETLVSSGIVDFWNALLSGQDCSQVTINHENQQKYGLKLNFETNEKILILIND